MSAKLNLNLRSFLLLLIFVMIGYIYQQSPAYASTDGIVLLPARPSTDSTSAQTVTVPAFVVDSKNASAPPASESEKLFPDLSKASISAATSGAASATVITKNMEEDQLVPSFTDKEGSIKLKKLFKSLTKTQLNTASLKSLIFQESWMDFMMNHVVANFNSINIKFEKVMVGSDGSITYTNPAVIIGTTEYLLSANTDLKFLINSLGYVKVDKTKINKTISSSMRSKNRATIKKSDRRLSFEPTEEKESEYIESITCIPCKSADKALVIKDEQQALREKEIAKENERAKIQQMMEEREKIEDQTKSMECGVERLTLKLNPIEKQLKEDVDKATKALAQIRDKNKEVNEKLQKELARSTQIKETQVKLEAMKKAVSYLEEGAEGEKSLTVRTVELETLTKASDALEKQQTEQLAQSKKVIAENKRALLEQQKAMAVKLQKLNEDEERIASIEKAAEAKTLEGQKATTAVGKAKFEAVEISSDGLYNRVKNITLNNIEYSNVCKKKGEDLLWLDIAKNANGDIFKNFDETQTYCKGLSDKKNGIICRAGKPEEFLDFNGYLNSSANKDIPNLKNRGFWSSLADDSIKARYFNGNYGKVYSYYRYDRGSVRCVCVY